MGSRSRAESAVLASEVLQSPYDIQRWEKNKIHENASLPGFFAKNSKDCSND